MRGAVSVLALLLAVSCSLDTPEGSPANPRATSSASVHPTATQQGTSIPPAVIDPAVSDARRTAACDAVSGLTEGLEELSAGKPLAFAASHGYLGLSGLLTQLDRDPDLGPPTGEVVRLLRTRGFAHPSQLDREAARKLLSPVKTYFEQTLGGCAGFAPHIPKKPSRHWMGDGTWLVGDDVEPNTYRLEHPGDGCDWARLRDLDNGLRSVVAHALARGPALVTITPQDEGFVSTGCGKWTSDLSRITASATRFGEGTYLVGTDITPGTYRAVHIGPDCYWARLGDFTGGPNSIITSGVPSGSVKVAIAASDAGFESSGCGGWAKT